MPCGPLKTVDLSIFLALVRRSFTGTNHHLESRPCGSSSRRSRVRRRRRPNNSWASMWNSSRPICASTKRCIRPEWLVASEGLNPSAPGARVAVANGKRYVVDGPFAESKELVGGFYLVDVNSLEEAIQWALRAPSGFGKDDILGFVNLRVRETCRLKFSNSSRRRRPSGALSCSRITRTSREQISACSSIAGRTLPASP